MKKTILIFALIFGTFLNISAQKTQLYQLFDKFQDTEGVTSIKISKPMFGMLSKLDIKDAELDNIKPMLDKIEGLRILVVEQPEKDSKEFNKMMLNFNNLQSEISNSLKKLNYEELMTVNSKGNKIKFMASNAKGGILDDLLLSINEEENTVLLMLDGKISMEDVNKLANEAQNSSKNNEKSYGTVSDEVRNVGKFSAISVSNGIKVNFTQGSPQKVQVQTDSGKENYIKTEVENGILRIYTQAPKGKGISIKNAVVNVTAPSLNNIILNSAAVFIATNVINSDVFSVEIYSAARLKGSFKTNTMNIDATSGSNTKMDVTAKTLNLEATSAAEIELNGKADLVNFDVSSAATVNAENLASKKAIVDASSTANLKVNVSEIIDGDISSGASVRYVPNSTLNRHVDISGGGSLKPLK